ncbi:hypothetical protein Tco_1291880 [Tanacetum coccineum]
MSVEDTMHIIKEKDHVRGTMLRGCCICRMLQSEQRWQSESWIKIQILQGQDANYASQENGCSLEEIRVFLWSSRRIRADQCDAFDSDVDEAPTA